MILTSVVQLIRISKLSLRVIERPGQPPLTEDILLSEITNHLPQLNIINYTSVVVSPSFFYLFVSLYKIYFYRSL